MTKSDQPSESAENAPWIAPTATVVGEVSLGQGSSVWYGAVIRGDTEAIEVGDGCNVQDLCCLHSDPGYPCQLKAGTTVGHGAIVHGAVIHENSLIGIGAIILTGATVGPNSIVAAGALVPEGRVIPPNSLAMGMPAKVVRQLTAEDIQKIQRGSEHYVEASRKMLRQDRDSPSKDKEA